MALGLLIISFAIARPFVHASSSAVVVSFTTVGTTSWTAPPDVTSVNYLVVAGGGGAGGGSSAGTASGKGGAGGLYGAGGGGGSGDGGVNFQGGGGAQGIIVIKYYNTPVIITSSVVLTIASPLSGSLATGNAKFSANPSRVRKCGSTTLGWTTMGMSSCGITRTDGSTPLAVNSPVSDGQHTATANNIINATNYTLTCSDGTTPQSQSTTVTQVPVFQEI